MQLIHTRHSALCILHFALCTLLCSCQPKNQPDKPQDSSDSIDTPAPQDTLIPSRSVRQEQYRPQVHYTVAHNWMNDPNGLCYKDGTWHLYYQFNPDGLGCDFGNMSWGHAESRDLIHWSEQPTVLYPDEMGAMFSGCSVVDNDNKAGFGAGAILAFYTASSDKQKICLAVSTDNGHTYQKYAGNPIVPSTGLSNFRDPKIVWDEEHQQYVMVVAKGWDQGLEFWRSTNLKDWQFVPYIFHAREHRCNLGQYECPDLAYLPIEGSSDHRWVMILSTMPGGYINGSGTMYFVGHLTPEGYFQEDEDEYPLWLDYGADYYAAVSWNNAPDNRTVAIGWANNWDYAPAVPTSPWKSAFALPREYSLREVGGKLRLCSHPVDELHVIAADYLTLDNAAEPVDLEKLSGRVLDAYELEVVLQRSEDAGIVLSNDKGERYEIRLDNACNKLITDRSLSGVSNFSSLFAVPSMSAPIEGNNKTLTLRIIVDQSLVEMFADGGITCVTNTVYPERIYHLVSLRGNIQSARMRPLETIWQ